MLASMILGLAVRIVAWRVGGVRKRLGLQLLGSSWWFVSRCLRIRNRFMINLREFHREELSLNCGRVVD